MQSNSQSFNGVTGAFLLFAASILPYQDATACPTCGDKIDSVVYAYGAGQSSAQYSETLKVTGDPEDEPIERDMGSAQLISAPDEEPQRWLNDTFSGDDVHPVDFKVQVGVPFRLHLKLPGFSYIYDEYGPAQESDVEMRVILPSCYTLKVNDEIEIDLKKKPGDAWHSYEFDEYHYIITYPLKEEHPLLTPQLGEHKDYTVVFFVNYHCTEDGMNYKLELKESDDDGGDPKLGSFKDSWKLGTHGKVKWFAAHLADSTSLSSVTFSYLADDPDVTVVADGTHKQARINGEGLIDVTTQTGGLEIKFYAENQVSAPSGNQFYGCSGVPFREIQIANGSGGAVSFQEYDSGTLTGNWTLNEVTTPETHAITDNITNLKQVKIKGTDTNGDRTETWEEWDVSVNQLKSKRIDTYHTFPVTDSNNNDLSFEELIKTVEDPDGAALTTIHTYGSTLGTSTFKKEISVQYPDGSWEFNQYDDLDGAYGIVWRPFKDTTMPTSTPTSSVGYIKDVDFGSSRLTYTNGHLTAKSASWTGEGTTFGSVSNLVSVVDAQSWGTGTSDFLATTTYRYAGSAGNGFFANRTLAVINPDDTGTKYSYQKGNYSGGTFTANVNGTAVLEQAMRGKVNAAGDDIEFVTNQSTATETIEDKNGNILQERELLYNGTDFSSALTTTISAYSGDNLTQTTRDGLVTYSATYAGDELQNSTDEFGTVTTSSVVGNTTTTTTNDGAGNLVSSTTSDVAGRALSQTTNGLTTGYSYSIGSGGGQIVTTTLPSGATSITESYRDGQIKSISGTAKTPVSYDYSAANGTLSTTQTSTADGHSRVVTTVADMMGRTVTIIRPSFNGGSVTDAYSYNGRGQLTGITSTSGQAARAFTYDALGNQLWSGLDMDGSGLSESSTSDRIMKTERSYSLDPIDSKWYSVTKASQHLPGHWVQLQENWSRVDGLKYITNLPNSHIITATTTVERVPKLTTVVTTDSMIGTSTAVYWGNNRIKKSQETWQSGLAKTSYGYSSTTGQLETVLDAADRSTGYTYYPNGVLGAGQLNTTTLPGGATITRTYTAKGQPDTESGTGTYYKHYAYNGFGELIGLATKRNSTEVWTIWGRHPGTGLISSKSYNGSGTVNYGYNAAGVLTTRTWARPGAITTTYGRNAAGDVTSVSYSDGTAGASGMGYDNGGRLTSVTDASGTRSISYSDYGQRDEENYTGTGVLSGYSIDRAYSGAQKTGLRVGGSQVGYPYLDYNYDTSGKLSTVRTQGQEQITYAPQTGMLQPAYMTTSTGIPLSDEGAITTSYGYDTLGRLTRMGTSVHSSGTLSAYGTTSNPIHYDTPGRRDVIPREDGSQWTYGYNTRNEVTSGAKKFSGGTLYVPGHQFTYNYDGIGNRTTAAAGGDAAGAGLETISYTPTDLNQYSTYTNPATQWITGQAAANANVFVNGGWTWRNGTFFGVKLTLGNGSGPVAKTVTVESKLPPSGGNMVVATQTGKLLEPPTSVSPTYDDDGNLTGDGLWLYTWDGENRLSSMETTSSLSATAQHKTVFTYDFEGRCVAKTSYIKSGGNWVMDSSGVTRRIYDGWNLIEEISSTAHRCYIWGLDLSGTLDGAGGIGGLLAMNDSVTGKTYWYVNDANGNVSALVDASSGSIAAQYEYGPFGELLRASGPMAKVNPFRFSTKYTDKESGICYYGYRFYNPDSGRWLNRDPIEEEGGINLYSLNDNNPTNQIDKLGLATFQGPMTERQRQQLQSALRNAISLTSSANEAIGRLRKKSGMFGWFNPSMLAYETYFGKYDEGRVATVKENLQKILNAIQSPDVIVDTCADPEICKKNKGLTAAYSQRGGPHHVWICPNFWNNLNVGGGLILHEFAHIAALARDVPPNPYGDSNVRALAKISPSEAIENADSYRFYADH